MASLAPRPVLAQTATFSVKGTPYDRLDLGSPDSALRLFLGAYRKGDYVTVFWILSPDTQREWQNNLASLTLSRLVRGKLPVKQLQEMFPAMKEWEQQDTSYLFAHIMNYAQTHAILPLDLTGLPADLSPANVPTIGKRSETTTGAVNIDVDLRAYPQPVVFHMEKSLLGKWRVRQIMPPGGDEKSFPFGLDGK